MTMDAIGQPPGQPLHRGDPMHASHYARALLALALPLLVAVTAAAGDLAASLAVVAVACGLSLATAPYTNRAPRRPV